ncbi:Calponin-homology (CH) domain-containing protein [Aphelenchoides fujianensis]|nr:Calponin-homology (CH) domain-containing protein [Aphelenchoides fujianensis]
MSAAAANAVRQTSPKPAFTNQQLIPIYTDWANRYLIKAKQQPIHDLTYDLRDPKRLVQLIQARPAVPERPDSVLLCALNVEDPIKSIEKALQYVCSLGVKAASSAKGSFDSTDGS